MRAVLLALGVVPSAAAYAAVKRDAARLGIDTSHFVGQAHRRGATEPVTRARPLAALLRAGQRLNRVHMKARLIRERILAYRCAECGNRGEWQGRPLSLHLDHVNGDKNDWRRENLRFVCPNCHAQTPTYCGRNKGFNARVGGKAAAQAHARARYRPTDFKALARIADGDALGDH